MEKFVLYWGWWWAVEWVWTIPSTGQGLLLGLRSEITPEGVQRTTWGARDLTQVNHMQNKYPYLLN